MAGNAGYHPYLAPRAMNTHHARGTSTPRSCISLLSRLRKGSISGEEQDSGFCTPGSGFESLTSPEGSFNSTWSGRKEDATPSTSRANSTPRLDDKVDFFSQLDGRSNTGNNSRIYAPVLSKIFSYLADEDIANASRVCKSWNRVINGDMLVRARLKEYLNRKISNVENEQEVDRKTNGLLDQRPTTPEQSNNKGLRLLTNITNFPTSHSKASCSHVPQEVPVNTKYNLYRQEGEKLSSDEFLTPCPRCEDPARVNKTSKLALCVNRSCEYAFCTSCFCPYTLDSPHTCPQAPPTPRTRRKYCSMNTKRSKANLKRLLR